MCAVEQSLCVYMCEVELTRTGILDYMCAVDCYYVWIWTYTYWYIRPMCRLNILQLFESNVYSNIRLYF